MSKPKVFFLCDGRACENCTPGCYHTSNIEHAQNYKILNGAYFETNATINQVLKVFESKENSH